MSAPLTNIEPILAEVAPKQPICVALSGGMDSAVLLHYLATSNRFSALRALHVNHQLSLNADAWQRHCEAQCQSLQVPLQTIRIDVRSQLGAAGEGLENEARKLRYNAFSEHLGNKELLLLAHHADDQYETLVLRLMRGAGVSGLASIPSQRSLGRGELLRPFLNIAREELAAYAKDNQLQWVEDESNRDVQYDRNYCRHEILPLLENRWPGYRSSLSKSMQLLQESDELNQALAKIDISDVITDQKEALKLAGLRKLSESRLRNVLRFWLLELGFRDVGWNALNAVADGIKSPSSGHKKLLTTKEFSVLTHDENLHVLPASIEFLGEPVNWQLSAGNCDLRNNGYLEIVPVPSGQGLGIDRAKLQQVLVKYRQGGEELQLPGRPNKSLKKLFQEYKLAPWLRARVPLLYVGDTLAFVPGIGVAQAFAAEPGADKCDSVIWCQPNFNWPDRVNSN